MSEKELADELYRHRHDAGEWSQDAAAIEARPGRTAVVSCRLPLNEFEDLENAADHVGESISDYVRGAIALRRRGLGHLPAIHTGSIVMGHVSVTVIGATDLRSDAPQSIVGDFPRELSRVPA